MEKYRCTANQMLMLDKGKTYRNHSLSAAIRVNIHLDNGLLVRAVNEEIIRNEGLRLHAFKSWFKWYNEISEAKNIDAVPCHDLTRKSKNEIESYIDKLSEETIVLEKAYKPFLINHIICDDCDYLVFKVLHVNMDACALILTLYDILKVYFALANDTEMPEELASVSDYLKKYNDNYDAIKTKEKADDEWTIKLNDNLGLPSYTSCNGDFAGPNTKVKFSLFKDYDVKYHYDNIDTSILNKLSEYCKNTKVNLTTVFLSAIEIYYSAINDCFDDISLFYSANLRAKLSEKKLPLTLASAIFFRRKINNELTFNEFIKECNDYYLTSLKHHNANISTIMKYLLTSGSKLININGRYDEISFGFIPSDFTGMPKDVKLEIYLPKEKKGNDFIIYMLATINSDGSMTVIYRYFDEIIKQESIEKLSVGLKKIIEMILDNPDMKVKDIMAQISKGEK